MSAPLPELTDELILRAMRARPGAMMTYVIRNILVSKEYGLPRSLTTAPILRRLKRMAAQGKVRGGSLGPGCHAEWAIVE